MSTLTGIVAPTAVVISTRVRKSNTALGTTNPDSASQCRGLGRSRANATGQAARGLFGGATTRAATSGTVRGAQSRNTSPRPARTGRAGSRRSASAGGGSAGPHGAQYLSQLSALFHPAALRVTLHRPRRGDS